MAPNDPSMHALIDPFIHPFIHRALASQRVFTHTRVPDKQEPTITNPNHAQVKNETYPVPQ
jgi:hypothetical protein